MALEQIVVAGSKESAITISTDLKQLAKELKRFGSKGVPKANRRAMNSAVRKAKTTAKRQLAIKRNLSAKQAESGLTIVFATEARASVAIKGRGSMLPLTALKQGVSGPKQFPLGTKATVARGKRTLIKGAFIARMPSGHIGVFVRTKIGGGPRREPRLPIQEQVLPSIAHTLVEPDVVDAILKQYRETYTPTLQKQLSAAIRRANERIKK